MNYQQVNEIDTITFMDGALFKAAKDGDTEVLFKEYKGGLDQLVDGQQNTALHVYSAAGGRKVITKFVRLFHRFVPRTRLKREVSISYLEQLLESCSSLLLQANAQGEIPLHVAARHGHADIVKFLIKRSKEQRHGDLELEQMVRMRNKDQNTALHMAAENGHLHVSLILLKEDPSLLSSVNAGGETPLYLAARSRRDDLVSGILNSTTEPGALVGPRGRTILHAAVLAEARGTVKIISERKKHLIKEGDEDGRTPLHYAAHHGYTWVAIALLENDTSAAYLTDKERGMSPLHMAAWQGHTYLMKCIIDYCPGCIGIVDKRGWNFLHFTVVTLRPGEFYRCFLNKSKIPDLSKFTESLLDIKDVDGITPLHVSRYGSIAFKTSEYPLGFLSSIWDENSSLNSEKKKKIDEVLKEIGDIEVAGIPVHDNFRVNIEKNDASSSKAKETLERVRETRLLVAILIATVTFTAAFTIPGGFKSETGTAILSSNSAFQVFVITNSFSFVFSLSAVFIHYFVVYRREFDELNLLDMADLLTVIAMTTMVIAFSTGLYAVLAASSSSLAVAACFIGITFFLIVILTLRIQISPWIAFPTQNFISCHKVLELTSMHEGVRGHVINNLIRMCNDLEYLMVHTSDYLLGMVSPCEFLQAVMNSGVKLFRLEVQSEPVQFMSWLRRTLKNSSRIIHKCFQVLIKFS
ncbi:hypothetical protein COLO4_14688 [Corchorus olitorius]|uniref:PGG domain-containing protein n=1 Tax=Corchorus olitorius TaxID=93759 RepID=A0A1R3JR73_9ROSI|nr:hypothetical protein COLO4_14688 [Corchorus olitorius]